MNNPNVEQLILDCETELTKITLIIDALGQLNNTVPFLTKYAIIKSCGTIEQSFKTIIADHNHTNHSQQIKNFIDATIRKSSMNPSLKNINTTLKKFDQNWHSAFKTALNEHANKSRIQSSLNSLNEERNCFAHGGQPMASFPSIKSYFADAKEIITMLDAIVI
ncbi:MAG: HEPN domain-containing protein [Bacteroidia bacterium]